MEKIDDSFIINKDIKLTTDWDSMVFYEGTFTSSSNWDGNPVKEDFLSSNMFVGILRGGGNASSTSGLTPGIRRF